MDWTPKDTLSSYFLCRTTKQTCLSSDLLFYLASSTANTVRTRTPTSFTPIWLTSMTATPVSRPTQLTSWPGWPRWLTARSVTTSRSTTSTAGWPAQRPTLTRWWGNLSLRSRLTFRSRLIASRYGMCSYSDSITIRICIVCCEPEGLWLILVKTANASLALNRWYVMLFLESFDLYLNKP